MTKAQELANTNSCWNKADDHEMVFILLGRDLAAPAAIRAWIDERIRLGKNKPTDRQIVTAEQCILTMTNRTDSCCGGGCE